MAKGIISVRRRAVRKCVMCKTHSIDAVVKAHQCPYKNCRCEKCDKMKTVREKKRNVTIKIRKTAINAVKSVKSENLAKRILQDMPTVFRLKFPESADMKKIFPETSVTNGPCQHKDFFHSVLKDNGTEHLVEMKVVKCYGELSKATFLSSQIRNKIALSMNNEGMNGPFIPGLERDNKIGARNQHQAPLKFQVGTFAVNQVPLKC